MSKDHHNDAVKDGPVACFVLTVSDTRTLEDDESGRLACELLKAGGHEVVGRSIVPDEHARIREAVLAAPSGVRAVIVTGGTGISPRDATIPALRPLLEAELPGFGEIFRMLSFEEIGARAMLSRALAGVIAGSAPRRLLFCLPGSTGAVRLGLEKLIVPALAHAAWEAGRQG